MKKNLLLFVIILLLTSCVSYYPVPRSIRKNALNSVYSGDTTNLNEKLNINGYFTVNDTMNSGWISHGYMNMMFFNDGMFVTGFHNFRDTNLTFNEVIPNYIENIINLKKQGKRHFSFYEDECWGIYEVRGDTIKVKHFFRAHLSGQIGNDGYEMLFKIIDRNHIIEINRTQLNKKEEVFKYYEMERKKNKLYFVPLKELPESDGWLKYKKWFWKDPEKYENWIKDRDRFNFE